MRSGWRKAFVEFSDTLVRDYDVVEFLSRLCQRSADILQVTAAGALLTDGAGQLQVVAASTEQVTVLETLQIQRQEGPCVDAYPSGRRVAVPTFAGQPGAGRCSRLVRSGLGCRGCAHSRCGCGTTGSAP